MGAFDHKKMDAVIVDHLAFSVPITAFMEIGTRSSTQNKWAKLPKKTWLKTKDLDVKAQKIADWQAELKAVLMSRAYQFINNILGVRIGNVRSKGIHGYTDSAKLLANDRPLELGFIAWGGNNDTLYFQISGTGCSQIFSRLRPFQLHYWLAKVLCVQKLARLDLAFDDMDGNYTADYAEKAYYDDAFKSKNGGSNPKARYIHEVLGKNTTGYTFAVGSRKSNVYWRIYDKALEQGDRSGTVWWRNEVELKKCNVDFLESPATAFASLNRFSESINIETNKTYFLQAKKSVLTFQQKIKWAKRQCGRTIHDTLEFFGGDVYATLGALLGEHGGKYQIPDTEAEIIKELFYNRESFS